MLPHCDSCTCGQFQLEWSDRSGWYHPQEFYKAVLACALDHSYDRTPDGVPYGIPDEYRKVFAPIVEKYFNAIDPDWKKKSIELSGMWMWDKPDLRAQFEAELRAAQDLILATPDRTTP